MTGQRKRKLIEVALPLEEINAACKADKDRKTGTIRNLHKWFAPMPLPAWRALLFAALMDDPADEARRGEYLNLIRRLVANGADLPDQSDVAEARRILRQEFPNGLPEVLDPFCGGGSTLLEAQRLGLESRGSDLNPIPVLITRTLTEVLPRVWGQQALQCARPDLLVRATDPVGYAGVIANTLHYAELVANRVSEALRHVYPRTEGSTPVAWLWARTARCPNPACGAEAPLVSTWWLSKKAGDLAWIAPEPSTDGVELRVIAHQRHGSAPASPKLGRGASFACARCHGVLSEEYLIEQGQAGRLGLRMTAVVEDKGGERIYREPRPDDVAAAQVPRPEIQDLDLPNIPRWFSGPRFGIATQGAGYTARQLALLVSLTGEVAAVHDQVLRDGGTRDMAVAVATLLGLAAGSSAMVWSSQTRWRQRLSAHAKAEGAFSRADMPMMWDFAEVYFRGKSVGDWMSTVRSTVRALQYAEHGKGTAQLADARTARSGGTALIATDPPYFDAIGYADISDYFYMWHRRCLRAVHPDLYATVAAPREGELTAVPAHHSNSPQKARDYFVKGFTQTFTNLQRQSSPDLPLVVVYASKEQKSGRDEETRWESILTAMVDAGLEITGTWPIHGTGSTRMVSLGTNSVATYVAMVARPRPLGAPVIALGDFSRALRRELGPAIRSLQAASILPVDMGQAVLGPGMSIFSRHASVIDQAGDPVTVAQAIRLINTVARELQEEQEGELDDASQVALSLWQANGWADSTFDMANRVARPKGTSVDEVVRAGVATSHANKVALLGRAGMDRRWRPAGDSVPTAWEAVHHLIDRLVDGGGEVEAATLLQLVEEAGLADSARLLAYRLAAVAASAGRTKDEERYNALIDAWPRLHASAGGTDERLF